MIDIDGKTQLVGVIGWPVAHSMSPAMHNAAFASLGLNWCYLPLGVSPENAGLAAAVSGLGALGFVGANVTVPHKQTIVAHLSRISKTAQAIGAVNTISFTADGEIRGDNTDAAGFVADLAAQRIDPKGTCAVIVGAGGSARAIATGLAQAGADRIVILGRTLKRAERLAADLRIALAPNLISALPLQEGLAAELSVADIVINCTPVGMANHSEDMWPGFEDQFSFRRDQVFYDLVYNPAETVLMRLARECGAQAISGLGMLVHQGALAFQIWTGIAAPLETMHHAAKGQLAAGK